MLESRKSTSRRLSVFALPAPRLKARGSVSLRASAVMAFDIDLEASDVAGRSSSSAAAEASVPEALPNELPVAPLPEEEEEEEEEDKDQSPDPAAAPVGVDEQPPLRSPPTPLEVADMEPTPPVISAHDETSAPRRILRTANGSGGEGEKKRAVFGDVRLRFYSASIGSTVPNSGGPCLGLGWDFSASEDVAMSVEAMEELRGGNLPDDEDELENEEWCDDWRLPREYFQDEGTIPLDKRRAALAAAGHSRCSIDLNAHVNVALKARRAAQSRSKLGRMVMDGMDVEAVHALALEVDGARAIAEWYLRAKSQRQRRKA